MARVYSLTGTAVACFLSAAGIAAFHGSSGWFWACIGMAAVLTVAALVAYVRARRQAAQDGGTGAQARGERTEATRSGSTTRQADSTWRRSAVVGRSGPREQAYERPDSQVDCRCQHGRRLGGHTGPLGWAEADVGCSLWPEAYEASQVARGGVS